MSKPFLRQIVLAWVALFALGLGGIIALKVSRPVAAEPAAARPRWNRAVVEPVEEPLRLASPIPGVVKALAVQAGAKVSAGDLLLELDDRELRGIVAAQTAQVAAHEARVRSAEVQLAERVEQLRRIELLRREQASSESEVQRARFAQQTAEAALQQARAELEAGRAQHARAQALAEMLTIRAPRPGVVLQIFVQPGESATPAVSGQGLLLLGSPAPLQLRAFVSEADAVRLQRGAKASVRAAGDDSGHPVKFERMVPSYLTRRLEEPEPAAEVILRFDPEPSTPPRMGQVLELILVG